MFKKIKAGVINMANSIMNAKQEERENKCRLVKTITKGVDNVLNYDGNKNLRKVAVVMIVEGLTLAVVSYMK